MASSSAMVPVNREISIAPLWQAEDPQEVDMISAEKFTVPEFVADAYEAIHDQMVQFQQRLNDTEEATILSDEERLEIRGFL
jgi:hypothetical protein